VRNVAETAASGANKVTEEIGKFANYAAVGFINAD
jgi:hypothetical protein